jgi:transcriptional regulator with XRE-family HTH domain
MAENDLLAQFGSRLTAVREARGLSQKQLAAKLRISVSTLSRHERGEASPRFQELVALRAFLGVSLDFLVTGEGLPGIHPLDPRLSQLQDALTQLPRDLREVLARFVLAQQPSIDSSPMDCSANQPEKCR